MRRLLVPVLALGPLLPGTVPAAWDLRFISTRKATSRAAATLTTLTRLRRHTDSGMFYRWYDPRDGEVVTGWPADGARRYLALDADATTTSGSAGTGSVATGEGR